MEVLFAITIGVLTASGVFLTLRARTYPVVMGTTLLSYAVNIFLFSMGRLTIGQPAVIDAAAAGYTDPLPQALVLTAIVISFGMTAFLIVLSLKSYTAFASDHVDGKVKTRPGCEALESDLQKVDHFGHPLLVKTKQTTCEDTKA